MNEATNLPPEPSVHGEPSPNLRGEALVATPKSGHAVSLPSEDLRKAKTLPRRVFNVALILFLVGLVAFGIGVAVALAVLGGSLDLQTGWVKDAAATLKDLAQHFKK
jgi:hypothetical protein